MAAVAQQPKTIRAEHEVWELIAGRAAYRGTSISDYLVAAGLARAIFDLAEDDPVAAGAWRAMYGVSEEALRRMSYRG